MRTALFTLRRSLALPVVIARSRLNMPTIKEVERLNSLLSAAIDASARSRYLKSELNKLWSTGKDEDHWWIGHRITAANNHTDLPYWVTLDHRHVEAILKMLIKLEDEKIAPSQTAFEEYAESIGVSLEESQ